MAVTGRKARTRRRRRSEFLVVVGVVGLVLLLQVLGSTFAGVSALRDADGATDDIFEFTAEATAERILGFLQPAEDAAVGARQAVRGTTRATPSGAERGFATVDTLDPMQLIGIVEDAPQVASIMIAFADETFLAVHREPGSAWGLYTAHPDAEPRYQVAEIAADGSTAAPEVWEDGHPFTGSPWYRNAVAGDTPEWRGIAPSELEDAPILHVVTRVMDGAETYAVIRVELKAAAVSLYLGELPLGDDGEAFLLSASRGVIAAPESYNDVLRNLPTGGQPVAGEGPPGSPGAGPGPDGHPASELGIPDARTDVLGTVYREDGLLVLETPLDPDGSPGFTLYLRATEAGVAPGIASFQRTMLVYSIVIGAVVVGGMLLVIALRAPLARLRERAAHDHLTGLVNRAEFSVLGEEILRAAERRDGSVVVAMFDLDNFKAINDTKGHEAGDQALVTFARALEAASRPRDVVARMGGDEFSVVRWLDEGEDARAAVERIRSRASAAFAEGALADLDVGASAGFAVSGSGLNDLGALVSEADAALVAGKTAAKGRTSAVGP